MIRQIHHWTILVTALLIGLLFSYQKINSQQRPFIPANQPAQGLIYDGLEIDPDLCGQFFRIIGTELCTHGPDPVPDGYDLFANTPPQPAMNQLPPIICEGNGSAGKRTQIMYVRPASSPDRYSIFLDTIKYAARDADQLYDLSAAETGASRRIRFVHDAACELIVLNVVIPDGTEQDISAMMSALQSLGYNSVNRKYMIFMDASVYCGIGPLFDDDRGKQNNQNNKGPSYGRVDTGCWAGRLIAHEHLHNLGAVQMSAPNQSGGWHCTDEYDVICYVDAPNYPPMQYLCPSTHASLFDCNHDDYFHTNPPPGNYLATYWNSADNQFLWKSTVMTAQPVQTTISISGEFDVRHDWSDIPANCSYELYRATTPYFTPAPPLLHAPLPDFTERYIDLNAASTTGDNFFYTLKAINCDSSSNWDSNETAVINFPILPGN